MPNFSHQIISQLARTLRNGVSHIVDLIWPPISLLSKERTSKSGTLNANEWADLNFNYGSKCAICSIPMHDNPHPEGICPSCIVEPPYFEKAIAPLIYDDNSKPLVLALKHSGRKDGVLTFANLMVGALKDKDFDMIIPVPLHSSRLFEREYNQSIWLGEKISKIMGIKLFRNCLIRIKNTKSQGTQSAKGRKRNIKNAFKCQNKIDGKSVLLIDDVFTTGSTANECARELMKNGAKRVIVLTLLRVNSLSRPET